MVSTIMANFKISYELLKEWENLKTKRGLIVYSNIPQDKGGETVLGVARKKNPNLSIWQEVDKLKKEYGTHDLILLSNKILENENITKVVEYFFENNYWKKLKCDLVEHQDFASNLLLLGVNAGVKRAIKVGQKSCGIVEDGIIGKQTINAWKTAGAKECKKFTEIEIKHYESIIIKDPSQERFRRGWLKRANAV
ncbi:hypothetical protein EPJ70_00970 [Brachyspira aalborgi]|uniref:Uncharacterized protein n=2 Tax=Brachyspira aalborgi TaxID=29522 RepID=A0A5C8FAE8_9SPIR|nr:hypothetical protein EPJ70_00970 [Brachyspira aalborgi]